MIFGSIDQFAVQVEPLEPAGKSVVGRICLWAGGMRIGDDQQAVLLSPIAGFFRATIRRQGRRVDAELAALLPEEILDAVKAALFEDIGRSDEATRRRLAAIRELCICPNGSEAFDGELAVLIERDGGESFIWQEYTDKRVLELRLAPGEYAAVMRMFLAWVDPLIGYDPASEHFAGKSFVIVGKLSRPHAEFARVIRRLGGRVDGDVSDRTSYVLAGEPISPMSPQIVEARSLGVPVLSEGEFELLLPPGSSERKLS